MANGFVFLILSFGRDLVLAVPTMPGRKRLRGFGFTFFTTQIISSLARFLFSVRQFSELGHSVELVSAPNCGCSTVSRCTGGGVRQRRKSLQTGGNATRCRLKTGSWTSNCGETRIGRRPRGMPLIVVSGVIVARST